MFKRGTVLNTHFSDEVDYLASHPVRIQDSMKHGLQRRYSLWIYASAWPLV